MKLGNVTPDEILAFMGGPTPVDNHENLNTAQHPMSELAGSQLKAMFKGRKILGEIAENPWAYGPLSIFAWWQKVGIEFALQPIQSAAEEAARKGIHPDIFMQKNEQLEKRYGQLLHELCQLFITGDHFDEERLVWFRTTKCGKELLIRFMKQFAAIERKYNSVGLTRLKAMKDMLKVILMVVTGEPLRDQSWPLADTKIEENFENYIGRMQAIVLNLTLENAFDLVSYSECVTGGKLGCSAYTIVEGSQLHTVTLRHYTPLAGVESNGIVLYLVTPLINKADIFDLAEGKSVVEGLLKMGFTVYLVDYGCPGPEESKLKLSFYTKTVHDRNLEIIIGRHPDKPVGIIGYCMGGTFIPSYLARRAEERQAQGLPMDISGAVLMASPFDFGKGIETLQMSTMITRDYNPDLMKFLFGNASIPCQIVGFGMDDNQPGVQYYTTIGFYGRATTLNSLRDAAPFMYWLTHGVALPTAAYNEWLEVYKGNKFLNGTYTLPSCIPELDGQVPRLETLREYGVRVFDCRGGRDKIAPSESCTAHLLTLNGHGNDQHTSPTAGHIFVVSRSQLQGYLKVVDHFFRSVFGFQAS